MKISTLSLSLSLKTDFEFFGNFRKLVEVLVGTFQNRLSKKKFKKNLP